MVVPLSSRTLTYSHDGQCRQVAVFRKPKFVPQPYDHNHLYQANAAPLGQILRARRISRHIIGEGKARQNDI
jgi:hypothetical protein